MATVGKLTKSERTREAILKQALTLVQRDGYESVTMRDLANFCELSLGAFYYHFKSKEEVVLELFKKSLVGHIERTTKYLDTNRPSLAAGMTWICHDRFKEFESYRAVLRVLAQRLDPHDPVSPWNRASQPIREQSVKLFEKVVSTCVPGLDANTNRQLARAFWLQHLLILGCWSFDRSKDGKEVESLLKHSVRLWKKIPTLVRLPGMRGVINLVLSPLERFEKESS